jgi:hypothetical protein
MKSGLPSKTVVTALLILLGSVAQSSAAVVPLNLYELGDDDPGALAGQVGADPTVAAVGGINLPRTGSPTYTADTVAIGSSLAMDFSGAGQRYSISPVVSTLTDNFGIEAWVQNDNTAANALIAYNGHTGTSGWGLFRLGGNYGGLFGGKAVFGSTPATVGQWTHLALVRDSGTSTLYVNGNPAGSTGTAPNPPAGNFMIGGNIGAEYFDGRVDRVRVFSFSPGQFNPQDDLLLSSLNLLGRYQLGEDDPGAAAGQPGGALTVDQTGTMDLSRGGSPLYTSDTPGPGSRLAMDFGGATGELYANSPVLTTNQDNWILEGWANADSTTGNSVVAYNGNTSTSGFGIFRFGDQWGGLFGGVAFLGFGVPVELDQWTHLALVRDGGVAQLYVDGQLVPGSFSNTPNVPSGAFMIGGNAVSGGENFLGQIDDVRLSLFTGPFDPATMLGMNSALVPEPSAFALAALGLPGLALFGRRRRR